VEKEMQARERKTKWRDQGRTQARSVCIQGKRERREEGGKYMEAKFSRGSVDAKAHGGEKEDRTVRRLT
jgi:hypothetical protein